MQLNSGSTRCCFDLNSMTSLVSYELRGSQNSSLWSLDSRMHITLTLMIFGHLSHMHANLQGLDTSRSNNCVESHLKRLSEIHFRLATTVVSSLDT